MKRRTHTAALACCCLLLALVSPAAGQEVKLDAARQKITTASFVRARSTPEFAAAEVARLKLGTVVAAVARTQEQSQIGEKRDYWYKVELPGGAPGWVFGGLLADYDPARRAETVRQIIEARSKVESMSFEDGVDFYNFVEAALAAARDPATRGELELHRLHAVGFAVLSIPLGQQTRPPYRDFHAAHAQQVFHHELAGGWYVRPDAFWALERKYTGTPTGDLIAWDAAHAPIGGECESDEVCQFFALYQTEGKYLGLYPRGVHAAEAVADIAQALASDEIPARLKGNEGGLASDERKELRASLRALRDVISKTAAPEKASILKRLDQLLPPTRQTR